VIGNPGRIVGWVDKQGNKLKLDENGVSNCGKYIFKNDIVAVK